MKRIFLILILLSYSFVFYAEKKFTLEEVNQPRMMAVSQGRLFISEKTTIYIYSLNDLKFLKKFGKAGEGPNEFKISHGETGIKIYAGPDRLVVNSAAKLSFYSLSGEFLREMKVEPLSSFIPAGKQFVSNGLSETRGPAPSLSIFLWDRELKNKKLLFDSGVLMGMGVKISVPAYNFKYLVNKDKIFLSSGTENIEIKVFNLSGKELYTVEGDVRAVPMDAGLKSEIINFYKTDPGYKDYWPYYKDVLEFPRYLPGLKDFLVDEGRIYVQTYEEKDNQYQWIIFDLTGRKLGSLFLPVGKSSPVNSSPFTIYKKKYYYLKEDIDSESWELLVREL